jgi:hypothetical protein
VCSLVQIYHRALLVLLQASALHGDGPPFQPCRFDLARDFMNHSVRVTKGIIVSNCYHCGSTSATLYPTWDTKTHVNHQGRSNTQDSIVHFYAMSVWPPGDFVYLSYSIIQEDVASSRTEESSSFQLSRYPLFNTSFIVSCALPPYVNLEMRFLLRGRVITLYVMESLIKSFKMQLSLNQRANQDVEV